MSIINGHPTTYKEVWIGLNDIKISDHWQWDDGTTFDFGTSLGSYPWDPNEPDHNSSDDAVAIKASTQTFEWTDR